MPPPSTADQRYNWSNHSQRVDGDFQQQYQNAERAYGLGDYAESHRLASGLLE